MATMNPWENHALQYHYPDNTQGQASWQASSSASDPVIYPGLYSPSGFDIMSILIKVSHRPNPQVELGPIDCSCAIVLCDLLQQDRPIVYASEGFCELTGYSRSEVLGKNCRFLQSPDGDGKPKSSRKYVDKETIHKVRKAVEKNEEVQIEVVNFKKGGYKFKNFMTVIPIAWDGVDNRYAVGFQVEID